MDLYIIYLNQTIKISFFVHQKSEKKKCIKSFMKIINLK